MYSEQMESDLNHCNYLWLEGMQVSLRFRVEGLGFRVFRKFRVLCCRQQFPKAFAKAAALEPVSRKAPDLRALGLSV